MASGQQEKVLLTGGSGFIASHILDVLLNHQYSVVVTVRSPDKGNAILNSLGEAQRRHVSFEIVKDVATDGAFDDVFKSTSHKFDYVVHTASPVSPASDDPVKGYLDPAIKGTTGILKSIKTHAPSVKRVVITSSSAAIVNPKKHEKLYDESKWCPITWEEALDPKFTYVGSKVLAEKAAWAFITDERPGFDLATINNTYTFGPIQRGLPARAAINATNERLRDLALGAWRLHDPPGTPPTVPVFTWVDVRDVALAHVRALSAPAAGGKRFYVVAGHFSNKRLVDVVRASHPALAGRLPPEEGCVDDLPGDVYGFDNARSREVLGLEYRDLRTSVADTVDSILEWQRRHDEGPWNDWVVSESGR